MEVTIRAKDQYRAGRKKEPLVVSQETWQQMQANGMAKNFVVVSTQADNLNDIKNQEYIKEFTKTIRKQGDDKTFDDYVKEYRSLKESDPVAALKALKAAKKLAPANKYVNAELKKLK